MVRVLGSNQIANSQSLTNSFYPCSTLVVAGTSIMSTDLEEGAMVTAVNGDTLTVTSLDPPTIESSVVIMADVIARNGVVHVIDSVLVPPAEEVDEDDEDDEDELPHLDEIGNNGVPSEVFPLGLCQGDCDSDDDCEGDLKCFRDDDPKTVPGCQGNRRKNRSGNRVDFCYDSDADEH